MYVSTCFIYSWGSRHIVIICRICHDLTVKIKFIKRACGELNNIFLQDEFDKKIYHNDERMSDSFYHITESSELIEK